MGGVKRQGRCRGQRLVENLQAAHGHPHVSRERLVHGGVIQRQEHGHIWLQGGGEEGVGREGGREWGGRGRGKSHPQRPPSGYRKPAHMTD